MRPGDRLAVLVLAAGLVAGGCGEFAVVNPNDPRYDLQISVSGPDSAYGNGEVLTFTVSTVPEWTGAPPEWSSSAVGRLVPLGDGKFRIALASYLGNTDTVSVRFGPHIARKAVHIRDIVSSIRIYQQYPSDNLDTLRFGAFGEAIGVGVAAFDSAGTPIDLPTPAPFELTSRDSQVVSVIDGIPTSGLRSGSTWLVGTLDGVRDSVVVVVKQIPGAFACQPGNPIYLALGDSVQLSASGWIDPLDHPLDWSPVITSWELGAVYGPDGSISLTSDGMVHTGSQITEASIYVLWRSPDGLLTGETTGCLVYVGWTPPPG